jgi:hypothetical protein
MEETLSDEAVLEFGRARLIVYLSAAAAALFALTGVLNLVWFGELDSFALYLAVGLLWAGLAFLNSRPYAQLSQDSLSVRLAPVRPYRVVPWSSVTSAARTGSNAIDLGLADGSKIRLQLAAVAANRRDEFVAALEARVGSLTPSAAPESARPLT